MKSKDILAGIILVALAFAACGPLAPERATLNAEYASAKLAWNAGRIDEACRKLEPLVSQAPELVAARFLLGRAYFLKQEYANAELMLAETRRRQPNNLEAVVWLAQAWLRLDRKAEAEALMAEALEANPQDPRLSFMMASLWEGKGNQAVALGFLDSAEGLADDLALVYIEAARLRWQLGNPDQARLRLGKAKAILADQSPLRLTIQAIESGMAAEAARVKETGPNSAGSRS